MDTLAEVKKLILTICEGFATPDHVEKLRRLAVLHQSDCALGAVPACTCGMQEAENFLKLFDGRIRGTELLSE